MNNFREWLGQSENGMAEVQTWLSSLESRVVSSIHASEGYISLSISSLVINQVFEVTEKGWKGKAAIKAASGLGLGWNTKDTATFARGMNAGKRSIPQLVGKRWDCYLKWKYLFF
jgi:hypothetical protein